MSDIPPSLRYSYGIWKIPYLEFIRECYALPNCMHIFLSSDSMGVEKENDVALFPRKSFTSFDRA